MTTLILYRTSLIILENFSDFQRSKDTPTSHSWRFCLNCYIFSHCKSHPFSLASNRGKDTLPFVRTQLAFGISWLAFDSRLCDVSTDVYYTYCCSNLLMLSQSCDT